MRFGPSPPADDHGDTRQTATPIVLDTSTSTEVTTGGELTPGDEDYFRFTVDRAGTLEVYTRGNSDTVGRLESSSGTALSENDDGGAGRNFRIEHRVSAGTYYLRVTGAGGIAPGPYTLYARFNRFPVGR